MKYYVNNLYNIFIGHILKLNFVTTDLEKTILQVILLLAPVNLNVKNIAVE